MAKAGYKLPASGIATSLEKLKDVILDLSTFREWRTEWEKKQEETGKSGAGGKMPKKRKR